MTQQPYPPEQPQQPHPPFVEHGPGQPVPPPYPATGKPPKAKRFGFVAVGLAAVVGLVVGAAAASLGSPDDAGVAGAPVTVTATATKTIVEDSSTSSEPTEEPVDDSASYTPSKSDWSVGIKVLEKKCFGSAGCIIKYRIRPKYVGLEDLPSGSTIEVSYQVTGDESGPQTNAFTVEDGQISFDKEEVADTPRSSTKLKAKVTEVEVY